MESHDTEWVEEVSYHFNVWWVNLGQTYAKSRLDGYIWAPSPVAGGKSFPHWDSMREVEQGDMVLCFAQKEIMAIAVARDRARVYLNRRKEGVRVDLDFHDLRRPVSLDDIRPLMDMISESIEKNRPFNTLRGINQGYLFNFSVEGLRMIVEQFPDRIPDTLAPVFGLAPDNRFSTFLARRGYVFDPEIIRRFILSLKTKPFVILSGKSGSGKTVLAHMFARYMDEKKRVDESLTEESDLLNRRWFKISYNDKDIVNAFQGGPDKGIHLVRKTMLKDGIMSLYGLDSKKNIDMAQKKMLKDLKEGDVIIAYQGGYTLGGIGVVVQPAFYDDSGDAFDSFYEATRNFIRVDWLFKGPLKINDFYLDEQRIPAFSMWADAIHSLTPEQIRLFSDYLYTRDIQINEHGVHTRSRTYEIIPVGSGWTDGSPLLGELDRDGESYTVTKALNLIIHAGDLLKRGMDNPFFLILDNMNESRVENYLSDILSAWETGEPVPLHVNDDIAQYHDIPRELCIPSNLFIVGTLKSGECAGQISRSVLDRANVIELESLSPSDYLTFNDRPVTFWRDLDFQGTTMANHLKPEDIRKLMAGVLSEEGDERHVMDRLAERLDLIARVLDGAGLELGYRVINDIFRYVYLSWETLSKPPVFIEWTDALDIQVVQRILPGIQSSTPLTHHALDCFYCLCFPGLTDAEKQELSQGRVVQRLFDRSVEESVLPRSAARLKKMIKAFETQGHVSVNS